MANNMHKDKDEEDEDIKFQKSDEIISKSNQGSIPKEMSVTEEDEEKVVDEMMSVVKEVFGNLFKVAGCSMSSVIEATPLFKNEQLLKLENGSGMKEVIVVLTQKAFQEGRKLENECAKVAQDRELEEEEKMSLEACKESYISYILETCRNLNAMCRSSFQRWPCVPCGKC
ncbi:hypothetical protein LR48_Vigan10g116900 [Vigna angularis]|uniref:Uncharacterized protein n=1 Tax=Phaseolus angularis TaxID=3914 RepID=A0A0L9VK38_PHAAN|nr:hypothetical protein LR48_Vigan10g116900 [Vigna angularis]